MTPPEPLDVDAPDVVHTAGPPVWSGLALGLALGGIAWGAAWTFGRGRALWGFDLLGAILVTTGSAGALLFAGWSLTRAWAGRYLGRFALACRPARAAPGAELTIEVTLAPPRRLTLQGGAAALRGFELYQHRGDARARLVAEETCPLFEAGVQVGPGPVRVTRTLTVPADGPASTLAVGWRVDATVDPDGATTQERRLRIEVAEAP